MPTTKADVAQFGQAMQVMLALLGKELHLRGQRQELEGARSGATSMQPSPNLLRGIADVENFRGQGIEPRRTGMFDVAQEKPQMTPQFDMQAFLPLLARLAARQGQDSPAQREWAAEKALMPTYEQEDPTKRTVRTDPFGRRTIISEGKPKPESTWYQRESIRLRESSQLAAADRARKAEKESTAVMPTICFSPVKRNVWEK